MSAVETPVVHTVVVGASAGGVEALRHFISALPADFPVAVLVVLHVAPLGTSVLPSILQRAGDLPACHAVDGQEALPGHIYVAPPNYHLLVEDSHLRLDAGPKINGHRPAIDELFRSAADTFGAHAAGVVLSGVLDDGTAGLLAIKRAGGMTLVQDPDEALYPMMPRSAIEFAHPDRVASARDLGDLLGGLVTEPPPRGVRGARGMSDELFVEVDRGSSDTPVAGVSSGLTCPDCQGGIWAREAGGIVSYICRVGHEYTQESFVAAQGERVEAALWTALRALEERAALHRRIAGRQRERGNAETAERHARRADEAVAQGLVLREVLDEFGQRLGEGAA